MNDRTAFRIRRRWRLPHVTGGNIQILLTDRGHDITNSQTQRGQLIGIDPNTHAVIPLPENEHFADPRQSRKFVFDLHQREIAEIKLTVFVAR